MWGCSCPVVDNKEVPPLHDTEFNTYLFSGYFSPGSKPQSIVGLQPIPAVSSKMTYYCLWGHSPRHSGVQALLLGPFMMSSNHDFLTQGSVFIHSDCRESGCRGCRILTLANLSPLASFRPSFLRKLFNNWSLYVVCCGSASCCMMARSG